MTFNKPNLIAQTAIIQGNNDQKSLNWGLFRIGLDGRGQYYPTNTTEYWMGISPPLNGYTTYRKKSLNGPSIQICRTDQELIDYVNFWSNNQFTDIDRALAHLRDGSITDEIAVNIDYPSIVLKNLLLNYDSGFVGSYPRGGNTWYDLSYSKRNCSLSKIDWINEGLGYLSFNEPLSFGTLSNFGTLNKFTIEVWVKFQSLPVEYTNYPGIIFEQEVQGYSNFFIGFFDYSSYNLVCGYEINSSYEKTTGFLPEIGEWYHIVMTYDGQYIRQYKDGYKIETYSPSNQFNSVSPTDTIILARNFLDNSSLNCDLYNVKIYNYFLSDNRVKENYHAHATPLGVISENLLLQLDAYNILSYPATGTKWKSMGGKQDIESSTLINGPTYINENGGILDFNGVDQYVLLPVNFMNPYEGTKEFTINIWFKTGEKQGVLLGQSDNNSPSTLEGIPAIYINGGGKLVVNCFYGGSTTNVDLIDITVADGQWHNVVVTYKNSIQTTYLDNGLVSTLIKEQSSFHNGSYYYFLGAGLADGFPNESGDFFKGKIGYFAVYSKALDPTRINNYNALSFRYL